MSATDLTLHGWDWLRAAVGLAVFLLPGVAAADRWLKGLPLRWLWAPVLSFTVMALAAILLDFVVSLDVRPTTSIGLGVLLAGLIARPRLASWWRERGQTRGRPRGQLQQPRPRRAARRLRFGPAWGLLLVLPFLFVAHSLPHLDGPVPSNRLEVPQLLLERAKVAAAGDDNPYPVHVDEHLHMAFMAEIDRTGEVRVDHPYTGEEAQDPVFTVSGLRSERGWQVAIVQFHQITGIPFPALAHFLPALWATYLGLCLWLLLRPAPGALAAAAFTAMLPTTLRFLGVGFLVPSAFGLVWILAVMAVVHRGKGPGRLVALALLITGGFFMHIVPGTVALAAGLLTAALRPGTWQERLGLVAALLLPMVWIWPSMAADAEAAVTTLTGLPFEPYIFRTIGTFILGAAALGAAWAWFRQVETTVPHRVLSVLALGAVASLSWSIDHDHSNDATYSRLIPILFLCLAGLAGLGVGAVASLVGAGSGTVLERLRWLGKRAPRNRSLVAVFVSAAVLGGATLIGVSHPVAQHMAEPYYRVFDATGWQALEDFAASDAGPDDVFLSHPWRAPLYNAFSGARPWTYLLPGGPPINGEDYAAYRGNAGADATWLQERGIWFVIDEQAPGAPHVLLGQQVYAINATA